MSAASSLLSEHQFLCSICLDVFTDPVTIPCGHNFCKNCISQHWDVSDQSHCPMCKKVFNPRPELCTNIFISEMCDQFRKSAANETSSSSEQQSGKSGEVLCDVCTETKLKALKSCLVCLTSYCETHLELHQKITVLTKHQLIDPVKNLEDRMCQKHQRPLEMFCRTDRVCVCRFCTESDHKSHVFVPLREEYQEKKEELTETEAELEQMIQERRVKIQELKDSVELSKKDADRATAASVQLFTALIQCVERGLAQLTDTIEEKQKRREKEAEGFIIELEEEMCELMKRSSVVEQLSHTEDHLHFLQSFSSLNPAPPTKDWTEVRVHSSYEGTVRRAVAQLEETLRQHMEEQSAHVDLKRLQQFAVDVTLDPDTAHPNLLLSEDGKEVKFSDKPETLLENPERFLACTCVVGKESFARRFYYEVQVKGRQDWEIGVSVESVNRQGSISVSPMNGLGVIGLRNGKYKAFNDPQVLLSLKSKPQKVGVFVDYEEGLVSFYDIDTAALIYSFTGCNFTEKIYPIFGLYSSNHKNSAPLVITPVKQIHHK